MKKQKARSSAITIFLVCLAAVLFAVVLLFGGAFKPQEKISASATAQDGKIEILKLDVDMTIRENRQIDIQQSIKVKFNNSRDTMFYQSLPLEGDRYYNIVAACPGNAAFRYEVAENPDMPDFIDINCIGGVYKGAIWTYDISYTMEIGVDDVKNGMIIDVVGFGSSVPLHDVSVSVHFPSAVQSYRGFVGGYGSSNGWGDATHTLSADKKTLTIYAERLDVVYNDVYYERMAEGITLEFRLAEGGLQDFTVTRIFTKDLWKILLGGLLTVGLAILLLTLTRNKQDLITPIHMEPPNDMDPMMMGKLLDTNVDNEDVTSMIYFFAEKGYLNIDFTNEDDPLLIALVDRLPIGYPAHYYTLFDGLFAYAGESTNRGVKAIRTSQLVHKFYYAAETAKTQLPAPKTIYQKKSLLGFIFGGILGVAFAFLACFLMGLNVGGGYQYGLGGVFLIPIALILIIEYIRENYRYKWKGGKRTFMGELQYIVAAAFTVIFTVFFARHIMTESEKILISVFAFAAVFITMNALSREEKYLETLGAILGFKDFITVTEEDKIKFMLEENPQLYYHILPYAQVLGVTDEWEKKFEKITLEPPTWYVGPVYSGWDYYIVHRSLNRAVNMALVQAAMNEANSGTNTGRSGGGGSFGGFGGGGHGGGGFGSR